MILGSLRILQTQKKVMEKKICMEKLEEPLQSGFPRSKYLDYALLKIKKFMISVNIFYYLVCRYATGKFKLKICGID